MKKHILILSCLFLSSLCAVAQQHALGLQVGFTQPIFRLNSPFAADSRSRLDATQLNGLKVGLVYDASLIKGFGFSLGLNYTFAMHNAKWQDYNYDEHGNPINPDRILSNFEYRTKYQYHQGEIFVDWQYKFEIAKHTYIILYTGPTIQCTFALKASDYYRYKTIPAEIKSPVASEESMIDDRLQRVNVTWGIGAGFQYKRYFLRGGYDFGLMNPYKHQSFSDYSDLTGTQYDLNRNTRGRLDQWQIKLGIYLWQTDED